MLPVQKTKELPSEVGNYFFCNSFLASDNAVVVVVFRSPIPMLLLHHLREGTVILFF